MSLARRLFTHAVMHYWGCILVAFLLSATSAAHAAAPTALTVNNLSDSFNHDCSSTCSLREAIANIASGGTIDFAPGLLPGTITLAVGQLNPRTSMRIQGPGAAQLSISANGSSRVFLLNPNSYDTVDIVGVTLRDGAVAGNNGSDRAPGSGATGQGGASAGGGCIEVDSGSLVLEGVDIRNCVAHGGNGGSGGSGTAGTGLSAGGPGGPGGLGGVAFGGGIFDQAVMGDLTLRDSTVFDSHVVGGDGGAGGAGGSGTFLGAGGKGGLGGGAAGGAIYFLGGNLLVSNSTIAGSTAKGGAGGNGGNGDGGLITSPGGDGGDGGIANRGLVGLQGDGPIQFEFATLANGNSLAGAAGGGGTGAAPGTPGQAGTTGATAIGPSGSTTALSTVIVGAAGPLCSAPIGSAFNSANLDEDSSCGFALHGSLAQLFRPLDPDTPRPIYMPVYHSTVIDTATTCNSVTVQPVTADQNGTPRPQGSACDLGAIEADYVFVDGFNG